MEKRFWQRSGRFSSGGLRAAFFSRLWDKVSGLALILCVPGVVAALPAAAKGANVRSARSRAIERGPDRTRALIGRLPLAFEPNLGQADARARFLARAPHYTLFLTSRGAVFAPFACGSASKGAPCWVRMQMLGADSAPVIRGSRQLSGRANYLIGHDPRDWRTGIPLYARIAYDGVYPGISLLYYGNPQQLEYDFAVKPHADPGRIRLAFEGPNGPLALRVDRSGDLVAATPGAVLRFLKPAAFQLTAGGKRFVANRYVLEGQGRVSLKLGAYDRSKPLVIDPALVYSTYLGGNGGDSITAIAVDGSGDAYVTGSTGSTNFPTKSAEQKAIAGATNAFVSELNPSGTALLFSTYIGGSRFDKGAGIALDSSGNAYVAGYTSSPDFPVTSGVLQSTYKGVGKSSEGFVLKLNSGGSALGYATYLGGSGGDFVQGIALDSAGNAYVTGSTQSSDFPVSSNPKQKSLAGGSDAFVAKLDPQGKTLVYSTFLGGSQSDSAQAIALDSAGEATVAGFTLSPDFPTQSPRQAAYGGAGDAFVARLNASGSGLVYSTYLGGSGEDRALGIAVDGVGDAFVTGSTQSSNFPTTAGAYQTQPGGGTDGFVAELNPAGTQVVFSTLLGGSGNDQGNAISVDASGNAYVAGSTSSPNFPTPNALQAKLGAGACASTCSNAFLAVINSKGSGLVYSTYLGGNGPDYGQAVAVDSSGNAYVAGITFSSLFPATGGAVQGTFAGSGTSGNGFVAKVTPGNVPALAVNPQSITFENTAQGATSAVHYVTLTNVSTAQVSLSSVSVPDEFARSGGACAFPGALAPGGAQCTIGVTFKPSSSASTTTATTGTLSISDNAGGSPQTVALSGTAATPGPGITFSPSPLNFPGQVLVGNSAGPLPVTLTNSGTAPLTITAVTISGSYTETDNCVTTLAPGASCTINVTFSPTSTSGSSSSAGSTANNTGTITVTSNITGTAPSETVNGTAIADFSLTSTGPSGVTLVSATSATLTIGATALLSSFSGSITFTCSSEVTCSLNPASITPGQTTTLTVSGLAAAGANPVTFTLTGTSGSQSAAFAESIPLQAFTLSGKPPVATIDAGQSAVYTVTVSSVNGFNLPVALSCAAGLPANASCSFSPGTVTPAPGAPQSSTLTVKTTAHAGHSFALPRSSDRRPPAGPWHGRLLIGLVWLALLAGFGATLAASGRKRAWLAFGLLLVATLLLAGCNIGYYGFIGSNPAPTGSPSGVYTITVAGTYTPASGTTGQTVTTESTTLNLAVK